MAELLIRPSLNDHNVVADLVAPGGNAALLPRDLRPFSRLVLNAHDAVRRRQFVEAAALAGVPVIVDPLTFLVQSEVSADDPWAKHVPFGRPEAEDPSRLRDTFSLQRLVEQTVSFQVEMGATTIVPPYFYSDSPDSPAFEGSLRAIGMTARFMRKEGVAFPLLPVLCAQHRSFATRPGGLAAIDGFSAASRDVGSQAMALCLSPTGSGREGYGKVLRLFLAARRLRAGGTPVLAWRQGFYGPALIAAGLDGYECGAASAEQSNISGMQSARKPRDKPGSGFASRNVYLGALNRSVRPKVAAALLAHRSMKASLVCDDARCCPHGAESMIGVPGQGHAVRSRAKELRELERMPAPAWRLHHVARRAGEGFIAATKANQILAQAGIPERIHTSGYEALQRTAEHLRVEIDPASVAPGA